MDGTTKACLNVTYNYSKHYYNVIDKDLGIRWLYGKTGRECEKRLVKAIDVLKDDETDDYWESTEGNAKQPLKRLLAWARQHPGAVFGGD